MRPLEKKRSDVSGLHAAMKISCAIHLENKYVGAVNYKIVQLAQTDFLCEKWNDLQSPPNNWREAATCKETRICQSPGATINAKSDVLSAKRAHAKAAMRHVVREAISVKRKNIQALFLTL